MTSRYNTLPPDDDAVTLTRLEQTCSACPSQWEATARNGDSLFIHFRHGYLSVTRNGHDVFSYSDNRGADGYMTTSEMLTLTGLIEE